MESPRNPMSRAPGKLKMVDCKAILGCTDKEWTEIGAILLEITKEFDLSSTSWSDQKYESATNAAIRRAPLLKHYLSQVPKDDRYRFDLVKRMITVKAKKQTELQMKRQHKAEATPNSTVNRHHKTPSRHRTSADAMSVGSQSHSPEEHVPISPKSSPIPTYTLGYPPTKPTLPEPYQQARGVSILSPQSAQSNTSDISDIFLVHAHQYVASYKNMQETVRRQEGEIYALQSKVIQLERQLDAYRRPEVPIGAIDLQRRPYRR